MCTTFEQILTLLTNTTEDALTKAEKYKSNAYSANTGSRFGAWSRIDPMIKACAAYFDGAVPAVGCCVDEVEVPSLAHNQPGQWTAIFSKQVPLGCFSVTHHRRFSIYLKSLQHQPH